MWLVQIFSYIICASDGSTTGIGPTKPYHRHRVRGSQNSEVDPPVPQSCRLPERRDEGIRVDVAGVGSGREGWNQGRSLTVRRLNTFYLLSITIETNSEWRQEVSSPFQKDTSFQIFQEFSWYKTGRVVGESRGKREQSVDRGRQIGPPSDLPPPSLPPFHYLNPPLLHGGRLEVVETWENDDGGDPSRKE